MRSCRTSKRPTRSTRTIPSVVFLLVSIDEDSKRLQRYLDEMKFPFPVVRLTTAQAEQAMGIDNTPTTFYVGSDGIVRYRSSAANRTAIRRRASAGTSIS